MKVGARFEPPSPRRPIRVDVGGGAHGWLTPEEAAELYQALGDAINAERNARVQERLPDPPESA